MIKGRRKPQYSIDEVKKVMKVMEKTLTIYQFMYLDKFLYVSETVENDEVKKYMREVKAMLEIRS
jgi:hypothetical protein